MTQKILEQSAEAGSSAAAGITSESKSGLAAADAMSEATISGRVEDLHVELLRHQHSLSNRLDEAERLRRRDAEELRAEVARLREECIRMRGMY